MSVMISGSMEIPQDAIIGSGGINLQFDGKHTVYEHQIICTMTPLDFNFSINPSAQTNAASGELVNDLMLSGSLRPYITTIGLYNEYDELIVVAKLAKPIKRLLDADQTVIIKFDA